MAVISTAKSDAKKYPRDLIKLSPTEESNFHLTLSIARKSRMNEVTFDRFIKRIHHDMLMQHLLAHYKIEADDADCWKILACHLALNHVPVFTDSWKGKVGRPKTKFRNALFARLPKKKGRPRDSERKEWLESLLKRVVLIAKREGLHGKGAITNALLFLIEAIATSEKRSFLREKGRLLPKLQKDISAAKSLFPEIAAKLPK